MTERKILTRNIVMLLVVLLFLVSLVYAGLNIHIRKNLKPSDTLIAKTQQITQLKLLKESAINLSKRFAFAFFDGTAFTQNQDQPVIESYRQFLKNTEANYLKKKESPLGGSVVAFGKELFLPEADQYPITYAVWIVTKIRTHLGENKEVIFITRVKPEGNSLVIVTAGAIPFQE
jgi:hypothetical protein